MNYVDYTYYTTEFGGTTVSSTEFTKFNNEAQILFDNYINSKEDANKLLTKPYYERMIKFSICAIIENLKKMDELISKASGSDLAFAKGIKSESVKDHSVSFEDKTLKTTQLQDMALTESHKIMQNYLRKTSLLWRGV